MLHAYLQPIKGHLCHNWIYLRGVNRPSCWVSSAEESLSVMSLAQKTLRRCFDFQPHICPTVLVHVCVCVCVISTPPSRRPAAIFWLFFFFFHSYPWGSGLTFTPDGRLLFKLNITTTKINSRPRPRPRPGPDSDSPPPPLRLSPTLSLSVLPSLSGVSSYSHSFSVSLPGLRMKPVGHLWKQ